MAQKPGGTALPYQRLKLDLLILLLLPALATIFSMLLPVNALGSILLFFGMPAAFLTLRGPQYVAKSALCSATIAVPFIIIIDYIAHASGTWLIPQSIIAYRLFSYVSLEVIAWAFLNFYSVIMVYEYFLDRHASAKLANPRLKYLLMLVISLLIVFLTLLFAAPNMLAIPYFYLVFGFLVVLIPITLQFISYPGLAGKFIKVGAYFFYLTMLYEITALKAGWWEFPSHEFIGWVEMFGTVFPLEELIFWMMLFALAILSAYEYYFDDER